MKISNFISYLLSCFLFSSCNNTTDSIKIIDSKLISEIKVFIKQVDKHYPCKSECIMVEINKNKIYLSNTEPVLGNDYIGMCIINRSKIFVYSEEDYSKFIKIMKKSNLKEIDSNYNNNCEPSMDRILIIDNKGNISN